MKQHERISKAINRQLDGIIEVFKNRSRKDMIALFMLALSIEQIEQIIKIQTSLNEMSSK